MALYFLIAILSCGFGAFAMGVGVFAVGYWASHREEEVRTIEVDPQVLAEVLAEKLELQALADKAQKVKSA